MTGWIPSFRTHRQYFFPKPGIQGVEKSVDDDDVSIAASIADSLIPTLFSRS